jgi:hypothetical protein
MTIKRIIPQDMLAVNVPVVADAETVVPETSAIKTTARVENVREGLCPICHTQMGRSTANGHEVHFCAEHSLVMPIRDPELIHVQ